MGLGGWGREEVSLGRLSSAQLSSGRVGSAWVGSAHLSSARLSSDWVGSAHLQLILELRAQLSSAIIKLFSVSWVGLGWVGFLLGWVHV